jgi:hypothetical protein
MWEDFSRRGAHTPFRASAGHRISNLAARGKPYSHGVSRSQLRCGLQHQTRRNGLAARSDAEKIAPQLQRFEPGDQTGSVAREARSKIRLRGKALAALCTARRENATASCGRHSRPETVAALANEPAGLVSALHERKSTNGIMPGRAGYIVGALGPVNGGSGGWDGRSKAFSSHPG